MVYYNSIFSLKLNKEYRKGIYGINKKERTKA
jgi:hypothetical protein